MTLSGTFFSKFPKYVGMSFAGERSEGEPSMSRGKGFTLIELLIVCAIIGILAAIAVPNMIAAISRGRQKRTMSDLRTVGTAIEAYSVDHSFYPHGTSIHTLAIYMDGPYMKQMPRRDGWRMPFVFDSSGTSYTIVSWGRDRIDSGITLGTTTDHFDCDIGYSLGVFVQYPAGIQRVN